MSQLANQKSSINKGNVTLSSPNKLLSTAQFVEKEIKRIYNLQASQGGGLYPAQAYNEMQTLTNGIYQNLIKSKLTLPNWNSTSSTQVLNNNISELSKLFLTKGLYFSFKDYPLPKDKIKKNNLPSDAVIISGALIELGKKITTLDAKNYSFSGAELKTSIPVSIYEGGKIYAHVFDAYHPVNGTYYPPEGLGVSESRGSFVVINSNRITLTSNANNFDQGKFKELIIHHEMGHIFFRSLVSKDILDRKKMAVVKNFTIPFEQLDEAWAGFVSITKISPESFSIAFMQLMKNPIPVYDLSNAIMTEAFKLVQTDKTLTSQFKLPPNIPPDQLYYKMKSNPNLAKAVQLKALSKYKEWLLPVLSQ